IKVGTDNSTFKIIIFMATTIFNMIRGNPSEYCSTAIAFFLGRVPIVFIAHLLKQYQFRNLIWACFNFLDTNYIRAFSLEPIQPAFFQSSTDSVHIIGNDLHLKGVCKFWISWNQKAW